MKDKFVSSQVSSLLRELEAFFLDLKTKPGASAIQKTKRTQLSEIGKFNVGTNFAIKFSRVACSWSL